MKINRRGMLLVISGPSGTGKGTLAGMLLNEDPSFAFSISCTTRAPRSNEIPDVHYHFITEERYQELVAQDAFLEHATVHGHHYGTLKSEVFERIRKGQNVLLDIDPQGAMNIMRDVEECVSVFILPPSYESLRTRLNGRNTDDPEEIERRLANARGEIEQVSKYDYAIVNDDLQLAFDQLKSIADAEKFRTSRFFPTVE